MNETVDVGDIIHKDNAMHSAIVIEIEAKSLLANCVPLKQRSKKTNKLEHTRGKILSQNIQFEAWFVFLPHKLFWFSVNSIWKHKYEKMKNVHRDSQNQCQWLLTWIDWICHLRNDTSGKSCPLQHLPPTPIWIHDYWKKKIKKHKSTIQFHSFSKQRVIRHKVLICGTKFITHCSASIYFFKLLHLFFSFPTQNVNLDKNQLIKYISIRRILK